MGVNYDQKAEVSELYQLEKNITVCGISTRGDGEIIY